MKSVKSIHSGFISPNNLRPNPAQTEYNKHGSLYKAGTILAAPCDPIQTCKEFKNKNVRLVIGADTANLKVWHSPATPTQ